uniref:Uncharacterized protein n=1 Tax=Setaria viridis TaxID=4556 RepID=A0A4U6VRP4_SETVI|nr:hypothetical protein SEVIR_2G041250v2 [Setaria viridis]
MLLNSETLARRPHLRRGGARSRPRSGGRPDSPTLPARGSSAGGGGSGVGGGGSSWRRRRQARLAAARLGTGVSGAWQRACGKRRLCAWFGRAAGSRVRPGRSRASRRRIESAQAAV